MTLATMTFAVHHRKSFADDGLLNRASRLSFVFSARYCRLSEDTRLRNQNCSV